MADLTQNDLEQPVYCPFNAERIDLPGYTVRFWTGVGDIVMLGQTWTGAGELGSVGTVEGSMQSVSPQFTCELTGLDPNLMDELQDYLVRGSQITAYFNLLDRETGQPAADPDIIFTGRVDQPTIRISDKDGTIGAEVQCIGALEWAMRKTTGRWIPAQQEGVWVGDLYCEYTDDGYLDFPWGDEDGIDPRRGAGGGSGWGGGGRGGGRPPGLGGNNRQLF